ncbi:OstA-like protein [Dysgonomonas alginatilytica]|uniref:OstA-like protein n=2 Tax=Dysgonomonas alginatilytica TaxID=1605892 RepID=A0A2V3PSL9_9BACT|nr:OstA-like protein [Dysgonomonas alginatilytica]
MHIAAILCLLVLYTSAQAWVQQQKPQHPITPQTAASAANKKVIQLIQAETLNKRIGFDPQILIDNVVMYHDGAFMYCDSAYLDEATNQFEAFGTVRVEQGDTLFLYGSYLQYDGNTQLLRVRNNVRLVNRDVTLFTDSLDYDRLNNIGYYFDGGMLVDSLNELTSYWGQYEPSKQLALFRDSVKLTNPKFVMFTDTLLYNTNNKVATILGPTRIESDSATIYSTRGWYDTTNELSLLLDQSRIINKEGNRILIGDSISYHKKDGYGEVFGNMFLQDTIKKIILTGNYGYYNEITNYAMATDSARAIEYSQPDSLFLHADTLKLITDSIYREIKGYYNVRFYRTDLQGVCDSLLFKTKDSILYMYKNPVLWNENNQILGDSISIFFNDSTIDRAHIRPNAFSIEQKDSLHFNQLKGRSLKAFFEGKQIRHILVEGNAESIFYPEEEDKSMMGMNQTESSYLSIDFKDKKIEKLKLWPKATGKMIPLSDLKPDMGRLPDFEWLDYLRPLDRDDVFRKVKRKGGFDPSKPRSNVSAEPQ